MAYPIRFKFIHKETGDTFKQWAIKNGVTDSARYGNKYGLMPSLNEDGNPHYVDFEQFYMSHKFLSPKDWELQLAIEKDEKGNWIYKKVGY